jgi:predicted house-cleaning noncanonical NTP pyrophosphatase (MazG superfamily)
MINKNKVEVLNILAKGNFQEKSSLLEEIWEERDVSMVSPLVDVLEMEKSRAVKKQILTVLNRLVMLLGFRDVNVDIDFKRILRSSDQFVRDGIVEIILNSEIPTPVPKISKK